MRDFGIVRGLSTGRFGPFPCKCGVDTCVCQHDKCDGKKGTGGSEGNVEARGQGIPLLFRKNKIEGSEVV